MAEMATDFPSKKVDTWAQRLHRQSHVVLPELFPRSRTRFHRIVNCTSVTLSSAFSLCPRP